MLTNTQKKWLGGVILLIGISLISPVPDFLDVFGFKIFSLIKGITIDAGNISMYFLEYLLLTAIAGVALIIFGLNLLGKNWKYLKKKLDLGNYKIAIIFAILIVALIAYFDVRGLIYWSSFNNPSNYTNGLQGIDFWNFFKSIAISIMLIVPACYYFLVRRDKSETLAIFLTSFLMWMFGLADVSYFVFKKTFIPETLPWLNSHPVIGFISKSILGLSEVTNYSLIVSVIIGFVLVFLTSKILKEKF